MKRDQARGGSCIFCNTPPHFLSKWKLLSLFLWVFMSTNSWSYGQYVGRPDSLALEKPLDPAPSLPPFTNTCNYVEFGTFDNLNYNFPKSELEILYFFDIKLPQYANGGTNTPDPYFGNNIPELQPGSVSSSPTHPNIPNCKPSNTSLQVKPASQSRYIGLAVHSGTIEGVFVPLNRSLVNGMKYKVMAKARVYSATCPSNNLNFQFSENRPCPKGTGIFNLLQFPSVPNINGNGGCNLNHINPNFGQVLVNSATWQTLIFEFVASGQNMNNLIIYQDYNPYNPASYTFIDDIEVIEVPELELICQSNCNGEVSASINGVLPPNVSYEWTLTGPNQVVTSTTQVPTITIAHPDATTENITVSVVVNSDCPTILKCVTEIPQNAPIIQQMTAVFDPCQSGFLVDANAIASGCTNCVYTWTITDVDGDSYIFPTTTSTLSDAIFPANINPIGAVISVTVSELGGCESFPKGIHLWKACCPGNHVIVIGNPLICETIVNTGDPILSQLSSTGTKKIMVYGDVKFITASVNINNCQFTLNNRSSLIFENTNVQINNSLFRACNFLWGGIEVRNGAITMQNSHVIESFSGLKVINTDVNLSKNTFERNFNHFEAVNCLNPISINNNLFRCLSDLNSLVGPMNSQCFFNTNGSTSTGRTITALNFQNCSQANLTNNTINGAIIGVTLNSTSLNISGGVITQVLSRGISAINLASITNNPVKNLNVLGVNFNRIGSVYNTWNPQAYDGIAIQTNFGYSSDIQSNSFSRIARVGVFLSRNGFAINTTIPTTQNIRKNDFRECGALAIQAVDNLSALIDIRENNIQSNSLLTHRGSYGGIFVFQESSVRPNGSVFIHSNKINDVNFGIRVTNQTNVSVSNNIITLNDAPLDNNINRFAGILLEDCVAEPQNQGALVEFNTIKMIPGYVANSSNIWSNVGVEIVNSPAANIIGNQTNAVGRGLWFSGLNNRTTVSCNDIVDAEIGWVQTYSDGIGNQGNPYGPNDNQWRFPSAAAFIAHTYTDNDFNNQTGNKNIYHKSSPVRYVPSVNNFSFANPFVPLPVISGTADCQKAVANLKNRAEILRNMPVMTPDQQGFQGNGQIKLLTELQQNNITDPDLIYYRDSLNQTSTSKILLVLEKVQNNQLDSAVMLCSALNCANPAEHELKMTIPLLQKVNNQITLLPTEMQYLENLAFSLPALKGSAVHVARQILRTFPAYEFEWFNRGRGIQTAMAKFAPAQMDNEVVNAINVYPNPATDMIEIQGFIGNYTIKDLLGKIVKSGETQGNIQVSELPRGIYMLHLAEKTFKIVLQ